MLVRGDLEGVYNVDLPSIDGNIIGCSHSSAVASSSYLLSPLHKDKRNAGQNSGGLMDMHVNLTENPNVVLVVYLPLCNGNVQAMAVIQRKGACTYFHSRNYFHHSLHLGTLQEYLKQYRRCPLVWYTGKPEHATLRRHRDALLHKRIWMSFFTTNDCPMIYRLKHQYSLLQLEPVFFRVRKGNRISLAEHRKACAIRIRLRHGVSAKDGEGKDGEEGTVVEVIDSNEDLIRSIGTETRDIYTGIHWKRMQDFSGWVIAP